MWLVNRLSKKIAEKSGQTIRQLMRKKYISKKVMDIVNSRPVEEKAEMIIQLIKENSFIESVVKDKLRFQVVDSNGGRLPIWINVGAGIVTIITGSVAFGNFLESKGYVCFEINAKGQPTGRAALAVPANKMDSIKTIGSLVEKQPLAPRKSLLESSPENRTHPKTELVDCNKNKVNVPSKKLESNSTK